MKRADISPLKKHIEESPKIRELKHKRHLRRVRLATLFGVLFATILGGFIYAVHYPKFQIRNIALIGNQVIDSEDVTLRIEKLLAGNYAYIIPHRASLFYPKKKIIADLAANFPRFSKILVYRTNLSTVLVTVTEIRGHALWCGNDTTFAGMSAPCYFTDTEGKIVALAPYYSGNVYPRFYGGSISGAEANPLGKTFLAPDTFQNLIEFDRAVTALGFQVKAIELGSSSEYSFVLDLGAGKTALLRFLAADNYATLVANLTASVGTDELKGALKADMANLEYFDLRFTNKVYYKFSDQ